jgi:hypothetical protein
MQWEYLMLDARRRHNFDSLGEIGYELVTVDQGTAYFKRPVGNEKKWEQFAKAVAKEILDAPIDTSKTTR